MSASSHASSETATGGAAEFGARWNAFWFTPSDPYPLALLRIGVGLVALVWLLAWTPDLVTFFGPQGMLPVEVVDGLAGTGSIAPTTLSYLSIAGSAWELYALHALSVLAVLAMIAGFYTRVATVATLLVVLSYIHRAEFLTSQTEPVLAILLFYLCLSPCGILLSVDRWRQARRGAAGEDLAGDAGSNASWQATVGLRLIQCHVWFFYAMIVLAQLTTLYFSGPLSDASITWLDGTAVWWLAARPDARLLDLTGLLSSSLLLINALTHLAMLFEVAFLAFIWRRGARGYLLAASLVFWLLIAVLTGMVALAALMALGGLAFADAKRLRQWTRFGRS